MNLVRVSLVPNVLYSVVTVIGKFLVIPPRCRLRRRHPE